MWFIRIGPPQIPVCHAFLSLRQDKSNIYMSWKATGMDKQSASQEKQTNHYYQNPLWKLRWWLSHVQMLPPCLSHLNQNSCMFHGFKIPYSTLNGFRWRIKFLNNGAKLPSKECEKNGGHCQQNYKYLTVSAK